MESKTKEERADDGFLDLEQFGPVRMAMPLDIALLICTLETPELRRWLEARRAAGDPGPVYFEGGNCWTDQDEGNRG